MMADIMVHPIFLQRLTHSARVFCLQGILQVKLVMHMSTLAMHMSTLAMHMSTLAGVMPARDTNMETCHGKWMSTGGNYAAQQQSCA